MKYELREFSWLSGCGKVVASAGSFEGLFDFFGCDGLNNYLVSADNGAIAEFHGGMISEVRAWFADHADYAGQAGCSAWRGKCDQCDKSLIDGKCDCGVYPGDNGRADLCNCSDQVVSSASGGCVWFSSEKG